jgi:predicted HAD superfamily Cof-like phosphohydrolase
MSTNWVSDINIMHQKYGVHEWTKTASPFDLKKFIEFRLDFIKEEYDETREAIVNEDAEEIVDGLIDLCVVAIGTLDALGINSIDAWDSVLEANMAKEVGIKEERPNPLGLPDLIKPAGWINPSHEGNHGIIAKSFSDAIKEKMMEANKARTDILSDNPDINSNWSPNAKHLIEMEEANLDGIINYESDGDPNWSSDERMNIIGQNGNDGDHYEKLEHPNEYQDGTKIDFTKDSEYIRLYGDKKDGSN